MAVLLVGLSVMAVMMTVAMPVWKQTTQREKEAELVFRGEQYARAIGLFQRKNGPGTLPPSIDLLVDQRFLRKKYKDPITNDDFLPLTASIGTAQPGQSPGRGGSSSAPGTTTAAPAGVGQTPSTGQPQGPGGGGGGIIGVQSKSKAQSIRIYNGRTHYNEWVFVFQPQTQAPGAGAPGVGAPGQRGPRGRPGQPGQSGQPPVGPGGQRGAPNRGFNPFGNPAQPRRPGR